MEAIIHIEEQEAARPLPAGHSRSGAQCSLVKQHMTKRASLMRLFRAGGVALLVLAGCSSTPPKQEPVASGPPAAASPSPKAPPEVFESSDFIITLARPGDSPESLSSRYLGSPTKAWMIEEYGGSRSLIPGDEVVIPRRQWNPPGVYASGYQLVPVLVYHNIGPQRKGPLVIASSTFQEQMRYLRAEGYRAVRLEDFVSHLQHKRQLPRKSVLITFDDGHKGFLQYALPILRELKFPAVLFIQTDQIAQQPNASSLSWSELRELAKNGVEIQAHSKTHSNLRRTPGESDAAYARRMHAELGTPPALFRAQLPQVATQPQTIAYPYGEWDEGLLQQVKEYGYTAGFTVRRDANPAFVPLLRVNRSQVLADWSLDDFKKNLSTFRPEQILSVVKETQPSRPSPSDTLSIQQWAARHQRNAEILESNGLLAQALDESKAALTVDPDDASAQAQRKRLESRIEDEAARRIQAGMKLTRASPSEAQRHFLAALALNPTLQVAFEALRDATDTLVPPSATLVPPSATLVPPSVVKSITHTVRPNETLASIAELYYGDRSLGDVIEKENGLKPGAPLSVGQVLKIPEVPGVTILRPD